ncbi:hypothetical protein G9A89_020008 [Geosiphon pyriformis]|nr:hypothetical protein G9A89_020008 [Geosiphon pyriformis]
MIEVLTAGPTKTLSTTRRSCENLEQLLRKAFRHYFARRRPGEVTELDANIFEKSFTEI